MVENKKIKRRERLIDETILISCTSKKLTFQKNQIMFKAVFDDLFASFCKTKAGILHSYTVGVEVKAK